MITPKLPLPARIAAGIGLTVLAGLLALWERATRRKDPYNPTNGL